MGTIYLLHYESKLHHAQHYVGYTSNLDRRIARHIKGNGAKLPAAFASAGIAFKIAITWQGTRRDERRIKNRKETPRLCPICKGK